MTCNTYEGFADNGAWPPVPTPTWRLVPLNFDGKVAAALRAATTLKAKTVADNGGDQTFTIPLKGFGQALDCMAVLSK